jgi:hypothetical protein
MTPINRYDLDYEYMINNDPELKALLEEWADQADIEFKREILGEFMELEMLKENVEGDINNG